MGQLPRLTQLLLLSQLGIDGALMPRWRRWVLATTVDDMNPA